MDDDHGSKKKAGASRRYEILDWTGLVVKRGSGVAAELSKEMATAATSMSSR